MITDWEAGVLRHTSNTGRYVTAEQRVIDLAARGLLFDHGPQRLAGGDHYLVTTAKGRSALNEWSAAQPRPKVARRRRTRAFDAWRTYCELWREIPFTAFLREVWPDWRGRAA